MPKKIDVPELRKVGAAIRGIRQAKQLTLDEVAKASGMDTGNLSRLERGLQGFSMEVLGALCKTFGVSVSQLLVGAEAGSIAVAGKVGLCISVPEVTVLFSTSGGRVNSLQKTGRVSPLQKTDRVMSTTAKVGNRAFGFRLTHYEPMAAQFPANMGIIDI
jgi:transcriptional regulator with XRE-family HTH domain